MIRKLIIHNIILARHEEIEFAEGLHILTGETGAGKTSFIKAFHLALGAKADDSYIKTNQTQAYVEAHFAIEKNSLVQSLLEEAGISLDPEEGIVIKRTLTKGARSKAFINTQALPLHTLQHITKHLVESIGYKSLDDLRDQAKQRHYLDLYAGPKKEKEAMSKAYQELQETQERLQEIERDIGQKDRELAYLEKQLNRIDEINPQEGEDLELEQEYDQLTKAASLQEEVQTLYEATEDLLSQQRRLYQPLEKLQSKLPKLAPLTDHLNKATIELEEVDYTLRETIGVYTPNPSRLEYVSERLHNIRALLKEYKNDFAALQKAKGQLLEQVQYYETIEANKDDLKKKLQEDLQKATAAAEKLSESRVKAARGFESQIQNQLSHLNLPHATFEVSIQQGPISRDGTDLVSFIFSANKGTPLQPIEEVASGGEMSRLLLVIRILLANQEGIPLLIFDEIDANIGGETASLVGERLRKIAKERQIFAITHFPQVASHAHFHFSVSKQQLENETTCSITKLDEKGKKAELLRMMGGKKAPTQLTRA